MAVLLHRNEYFDHDVKYDGPEWKAPNGSFLPRPVALRYTYTDRQVKAGVEGTPKSAIVLRPGLSLGNGFVTDSHTVTHPPRRAYVAKQNTTFYRILLSVLR